MKSPEFWLAFSRVLDVGQNRSWQKYFTSLVLCTAWFLGETFGGGMFMVSGMVTAGGVTSGMSSRMPSFSASRKSLESPNLFSFCRRNLFSCQAVFRISRMRYSSPPELKFRWTSSSLSSRIPFMQTHDFQARMFEPSLASDDELAEPSVGSLACVQFLLLFFGHFALFARVRCRYD